MHSLPAFVSVSVSGSGSLALTRSALLALALRLLIPPVARRFIVVALFCGNEFMAKRIRDLRRRDTLGVFVSAGLCLGEVK